MQPDLRITIIGAGLAGALLGVLLARRGWQVEIFEKRPDPRLAGYEGGRSINLALAERGLDALRQAGLETQVMEQAVMMRGRMVHFADGRTQLQRYGRDDSEVIWSVHRGRLVLMMLDAAEASGAKVHFDQRFDGVDFEGKTFDTSTFDGTRETRPFDVLLGADGAGSSLRAAMQRDTPLGERFEPLGHGYKELEIPPAADGGWRIEPNALHIWPRGGYMCIALPNTERTFTVTLFLPNEGDPSFATIDTVPEARALFERDFADALEHIPELGEDFVNNPVGMLGTLYLDRWHRGGAAVLLGDAAHAMVPFHGQGMNCAFEDCVALVRHIDAASDFGAAFAAFEAERKPNALAIQHMALENYIEMRDRVDDADYLLQRELERLLAERHPGRFVPRYAMVTFGLTPYAVALERGNLQRALLVEATRGAASIDDVDLERADTLVRERLSPLS
ncbi:FAD-dependent oxidoreductase [Chiayiivirga flava]|uniref:Kynurenine 3-monooxygenase n=1 Tax=Chiayiivirga flava TaxID=659595 RepID=A0A7W8G190_9GAMM|nr:NAD(P)/FAD-dependent oxidoreductase [Chiayiivirga flava]MBB5208613.1 kynurenine 3-monooxygenase [Chiayiivirga flava]